MSLPLIDWTNNQGSCIGRLCRGFLRRRWETYGSETLKHSTLLRPLKPHLQLIHSSVQAIGFSISSPFARNHHHNDNPDTIAVTHKTSHISSSFPVKSGSQSCSPYSLSPPLSYPSILYYRTSSSATSKTRRLALSVRTRIAIFSLSEAETISSSLHLCYTIPDAGPHGWAIRANGHLPAGFTSTRNQGRPVNG
jgi:hypothetical protein